MLAVDLSAEIAALVCIPYAITLGYAALAAA